jgi:hypothetical protein
MFQWCRYYYLTNPIIAAVVNKMAEYPITDIVIESDNDGVKQHWEEFLEDTLKIRSFLIDMGLYFMNYGNAIVSVFYPFTKFLRCENCDTQHSIRDVQYKFHGFKFILTCPNCGLSGPALAKDVPIKAPRQIRLILWNPEDIDVEHNDISGEDAYYYNIPKSIRNDITLGKPHTLETMPQLIIDAVRLDKSVKLNPDNVYHVRRPSILTGVRDSGVGVPLLLPVLKDVFYLQVLKKANEQIAMELVYPLNVMFPQGTDGMQPFQSIDLRKWRDQVQEEVARWRLDRAYIPLLPIPIGHQVIGGQGRALMLHQEIKIVSDQIISGMGVPQEFVYGGLQWSGSNVSLRMLENHFLGYISDLVRFLKGFLIKNIAAYLDWAPVGARFKPFKMADDIQRKALLFQINGAGKISDRTLLSDMDLDPDKEDKVMEQETSQRMAAVKRQQLAQAEIQGEAQLTMARFQARAQTVMMQEQMEAQKGTQDMAPGEPREGIASGAPGGAAMGPNAGVQQAPQGAHETATNSMPKQVAVPEVAREIALQISNMPPQHQQIAIQQISEQNPELAKAVSAELHSGSGGGQHSEPLPEHLPPRRNAGAAVI